MAILLVDDHKEPREEARQALKDIFDTSAIFEFEDPQQALALFTRNPNVNIIVTDIVMPDMDGLHLAQKALEERLIPILFHTGSWSREYLYSLAFHGSFDQLPIDIVQKRYFFDSEDAYRTEFKTRLEHAQERARSLAPPHRVNTDILSSLRERLHGKTDHLVEYVKTVYQELARGLEAAANALPETSMPAEDRERLRTLPRSLDLSQDTTEYFLHAARYVVVQLGHLLRAQPQNPALAHILTLYTKLAEVHHYLTNSRERYHVSAVNAIAHKRTLVDAPRTELPAHTPPLKLEYRLPVLDHTRTPFRVINPDEHVLDAARDIQFTLDITGKAIARSMHCAEDGAIPLAGFFDSIPFSTYREGMDAVERIRRCDSPALKEFGVYRQFVPPTEAGMYVLIEPFQDTKYLGAVLEHPHDEHLLLIEFKDRQFPAGEGPKYFVLYNTATLEVLHTLVPEDVDPQQLAQQVQPILNRNRTLLAAQGVSIENTAYQTEIGFTPGGSVYDFQTRTFKPRKASAGYAITPPYPSQLVFGITPPEGIKAVVASTDEPETLSLLSKRAAEDGLQVAYVLRDQVNPNLPSYIPNLGVLITGKNLAVQEHGLFNALVTAQHTLLLDQAQLSAFPFEPGDIVKYVSNGRVSSIQKLDRTEDTKYRVRAILNK